MKYNKVAIQEAVTAIKKHNVSHVDTVVVLGSGLSHLADKYENEICIPFSEIPHMSASSVAGHKSRIIIIEKHGKMVAFVQGRMHMYEGYSAFQSAFTVAVMAELGAKTLIVTNAAGGLNPTFKPGDIMMIEDHIKTQFFSPLEGIEGNERFVDMQNAYNVSLFDELNQKFQIKKGVYVSTLGPQYETPAEVRHFQQIGGDSVGMSTVMETIMARFYKMNVFAFSMITNCAAGLPGAVLEHSDVVHQANTAGEKLGQIIESILEK
ncbi:MAG: purine-nucleoside phosphorylase [Brevinema sp.]